MGSSLTTNGVSFRKFLRIFCNNLRPKSANTYEIIVGERRWRAAQLVGLKEIPCIISSDNDKEVLIKGLIENLSRQDLNPIEEAKGIARLIEEFKLGHEEVGKILGKSRSEVSNLVRLLKLDNRVHTLLMSGDLSETQGKLLAGVPKDEQYPLARKAIAKEWSSRGLEKAIQQKKGEEKSQKKAPVE